MNKGFTIIIADRNPHVGEFLKREMMGEGYRVLLAKNGLELISHLKEHADLMILDPDLPDIGELALAEMIHQRCPALPLVVHTFVSDRIHHPAISSGAVLVEKNGSSIEQLKRVALEVLQRVYPLRPENTKAAL